MFNCYRFMAVLLLSALTNVTLAETTLIHAG